MAVVTVGEASFSPSASAHPFPFLKWWIRDTPLSDTGH